MYIFKMCMQWLWSYSNKQEANVISYKFTVIITYSIYKLIQK